MPARPGGPLLQAAEAHFRAGRLAEALGLCEELLQSDPEHDPALFLAGLIALRAKEYALATGFLERAASLNPANPVYLNSLGMALHGGGQVDAATGFFRQAAELNPGFAEAHCNLGVVLAKSGLMDQALHHYRQAVALNPGMVEVHINLGNLYRDRGKLEEALGSYRSAIALQPERADAHAGLAMTLFDLGRLEETRQAVDHALHLDPEQVQALNVACRSRKMGPGDAAWLATAQRVLAREHPPLPPEEAITLGYALGKFHDDLGQYEPAFAAYRQANALRRRQIGPFDRAEFSRLIDAIIRSYTPQHLAQLSNRANVSSRPVWIVGMPRSGTSLVEQIIAAHPRAFGAGELFYWTERAREDKAALVGGQLDEAAVARLAEGYGAHLATHSAEAERVVDKMPNNFLWLGPFHAAFPQARIIHTLRNPADTCLSIYFQNFKRDHTYATDLDDLAYYYREYARLMQHWRSVLPADRLLEVPYEALVEDQAAWSRRLVDFIGLEWDERCLDFHTVERKVATASNWQVRQPVYQSSKARWRHYESHLGALLDLLPP